MSVETTLADLLRGSAFQGYAYSYPHKMAYRRLDPPVLLSPLWAAEDRAKLFLYVHLPFCEMRCGFCNLFTTTNPEAGFTGLYLDALERQMCALAEILDPHAFRRAAFGGGTPSFLSTPELERLFTMLQRRLGGLESGVSVSFETSPATVTAEKLAFLRERGITRLSIGVQSFLLEETKALGRPQKPAVLHDALELLRNAHFPILNLDLIYGIPGQTASSWQASLEAALHYAPAELYLYPLYVRPLTGLDRLGREPGDTRLELLEQARDYLATHGYEQISMRLFRRRDVNADPAEGPVYCCQEDGMVGLGAGARSYTAALHYSSEYAVGRTGIREILEHYTQRETKEFMSADYGCAINPAEQRRRYVIKSLLRREGLDTTAYQAEFGTSVWDDVPELRELPELDLAATHSGVLRLTPVGMNLSDVIGPWLYSREMRELMENFALA